jgi:hypothetical protein
MTARRRSVLLLASACMLLAAVSQVSGASSGKTTPGAPAPEQEAEEAPLVAGAPVPEQRSTARRGANQTSAAPNEGGWRQGRASWYGTPQPYADYFAKTRPGGLDAFGITEWGGCGYTNSYDGVGEVVFPKEAIAAYGDANDDSPGGCS